MRFCFVRQENIKLALSPSLIFPIVGLLSSMLLITGLQEVRFRKKNYEKRRNLKEIRRYSKCTRVIFFKENVSRTLSTLI